MNTQTDEKNSPEPLILPVLPLRDVVVYPGMVIPLFVGRDPSIRALEYATSQSKEVFLVSQKDPTSENPGSDDLYTVGTVAHILQLLRLPDGAVKVLVEGQYRAQAVAYPAAPDNETYIAAHLTPFGGEHTSIPESSPSPTPSPDLTDLARSLLAQFEQYLKLNRRVPAELLNSLTGIEEPSRLCDAIAAHIPLKMPDKQKLLETWDVTERLESLMQLLETEIELLQVDKKIRARIKKQMEKSQREYYLNEHMKAIQKELGELENVPNDFDALAKKITQSGMPKEAREKANSELNKLKMMPPMSAESTVSRNYLEYLLELPWKRRTKLSHDLDHAEQILNQDHHGLEKVKERILEFLAVQQRIKNPKGPILCLVGPPGVGKTSLGQSIAKATHRKFTRMALGGVRDEAEIRGHRRTYIGSMPGKIIQKIAKCKVKNPLFLLDEIDKMAMDFRGDPASALLEVLDPEQNRAFNDHYLEVDYDLSDVMFIATANSLNIPGPLLDRMEVIRLSGYTEDEKRHIAMQYLIPKQMRENGLHSDECVLSEAAIVHIIRYYTREAGVRGLERALSKIFRKVLKAILSEGARVAKKHRIGPQQVEKYLGVPLYRYGMADESDRIGLVNGLAWTEVGGDLLTIEAAAVHGKGHIVQTGHLGDVMKESIQAAMTVVRSRSTQWAIPPNFYEKWDMHIHVPEGATPKDGPSAGIAICAAMVSAITRIPVKASVAMTGEITLRGEVLPIGGLKEKLLAAHRAGIKTVVFPHENQKDLKEIPANIVQSLEMVPVRWIDEVLHIALTAVPTPLEEPPAVSSNHGPHAGGMIPNEAEIRH